MMNPSEPATTFHLPEGLHYECIQCGRSCKEFGEIRVDPAKAASIRALPRESLCRARNPENPVVESAGIPGTQVMRLEGGGCCMQTGDGLCSIHQAFGLSAKPNICQSFPYRFVETPGGVYVGVSHVCSAVLNKTGPAVTDQRAGLEELFAFTQSRRQVSEPFVLTEDLPLSWAQYAGVEEDLAAILQSGIGHIGQRLVMQAIYIRLLITFLREARQQAGAVLSGPEANGEALAVFRRRMRGTDEEPWAIVRKLSLKRRPSPLLRRMFLGFAHALLNTTGKRRGRLHSYMMLLDTYLRHASGRGVLRLPALSHPVPYKVLKEIRFDPARPELDGILTEYFSHCLFRKDLLLKECIQFAHCMQLMQWGLIHWYSAAFAADAGSGEIQPEHLREGIRAAEKFFVFHTRIDNLFRNYPLLRGFMDRMFDHPLYALSMGNGEWER